MLLLKMLITFRVSRRRRKMYCGHARLSVCPRLHAHGAGSNLGEWWGMPHSCAQCTVGRICNGCTGCVAMATTRRRNVNECMLVLALCLVMAALCSRGALYFCPVVSFLLPSIFFSSPNLSGRRSDVCHTSTHGVALVRI